MNVELGLLAFPILPPLPLTIDHAPVPITGVLAASVVAVTPHIDAPVWSGPALATVGFSWNVITTSSTLGAQGGLLIVQRNV